MVGPRNMPRFDDRFAGYGMDKVELNYSYLVLMFIEGIIFGIILLLFLNDITIFSIRYDYHQVDLLLNLYLSIGAGIWEEILFRLLIFSLFLKIFNNVFKNYKYLNIFCSIIISSVIFSGFHYIGFGGDKEDTSPQWLGYINHTLFGHKYENELYFGGKTITGTTSEASAVVQSQSSLIKAPYHLTRLVNSCKMPLVEIKKLTIPRINKFLL